MADTTPTRGPNPDTYPGTPRWVKLSGIVVVIIVLLFGGLHLAGRGMGPGSHVPPTGGQ